MRVICIDAKPEPGDFNSGFLVENDVYTVRRETIGVDIYGNEEVLYQLEEIKGNWGFSKRRFIPISTIDETEMHREYNSLTTKA